MPSFLCSRDNCRRPATCIVLGMARPQGGTLWASSARALSRKTSVNGFESILGVSLFGAGKVELSNIPRYAA